MVNRSLPQPSGNSNLLLSCQNLHLGYGGIANWKSVVKDLTFDVANGETLALVGESGSGKSTVAKSLVKLIPVKEGSIQLDGDEVAHLNSDDFAPYRKRIQLIFQDPWRALNPRVKVRELLEEPLDLHFPELDRPARREKVKSLLDSVHLEAASLDRYPSEFSGGQRQRILIARSLAVEPKLLVCDEPVSALDVSIQAQLLDLLAELKSSRDLTLLFISHDLAVVQQIADRVLVLKKGEAVEFKDSSELFRNPEHPYTKSLIEACPKW